ncbi:MAG: hypothetical protein DWI01_01620 [Planctomycetota bacterium]|nr:MAG: hypothetical protein DWI01_01620 [Planctomycetota bacterium]
MSRSASTPADADPPPRPGSDGPAADPLDDIRLLLDGLAPSAAPSSLASTTIEMAAVSATGRSAPRTKPSRTLRRSWWGPAGCVVGALAIGLVVGRATTPDPDERILEYLPVVEHLGVLQEAGSVAFLRSVAERAYPPPRRFPFGRPPEERPADGAARPDSPPAPPEEDDDWLQLNDTLEALQDGPFGPETPASELDVRRERVEELDAEERRRLADAAAAFQGLPLARRHDVIELARALGEGDPDGELGTLVGAARSWHRWLAWRDPADRHSVVALEAHERLEWLDRYARFNARPRFPQTPPGRGDGGEPPGRGWPGGFGFGGDRPGTIRGNRNGSEQRGERGRGGMPRPPASERPAEDRPVTVPPEGAAETP